MDPQELVKGMAQFNPVTKMFDAVQSATPAINQHVVDPLLQLMQQLGLMGGQQQPMPPPQPMQPPAPQPGLKGRMTGGSY